MAAPTYTPLPTAPARTMTPTAFAAAADAFVAALAAFQTEGDTLGAYTKTQAEAALAAAIAGNLSGLDLTALAGWVIGVNNAGDALEGVELVPPSNATETAAGIVEKATTAEGTTPVADKFPDTVVVDEMIDSHVPTLFSASGSAPMFACRAWVHFDGTLVDGVADLTGVLGSGNIASVVDNGTGLYTVTFTTAMDDANYAVTAATHASAALAAAGRIAEPYDLSATGFKVSTAASSTGGAADNVIICLAVFR